jgi:hypothetical protein
MEKEERGGWGWGGDLKPVLPLSCGKERDSVA